MNLNKTRGLLNSEAGGKTEYSVLKLHRKRVQKKPTGSTQVTTKCIPNTKM